MNPKIFCKVCNTKTKYTKDNFSRCHLKKYHPEIKSIQNYYDKYLKKCNEGICIDCTKRTTFINFLNGYRKRCKICGQISEEKRNKVIASCKQRDYKKIKKKYNKTCQERFGTNGYTQTKEWKKQYTNTIKKHYEVKHNFLIKDVIDKRNSTFKENREEIKKKRQKFWTKDNTKKVKDMYRKTCLEKYGVDNTSRLLTIRKKLSNKFKYTINKIRKTNEELGYWIPLELKSELDKYYFIIRKITKNNIEYLFNNWNGECYYSKEKLVINEEYKKNNPRKSVNTNPLQPSIDHKKSILWGFKNNILPEVIGSLENLCICSKSINPKKGYMNEDEFMKKLNEND